jgi:hypothetical protein
MICTIYFQQTRVKCKGVVSIKSLPCQKLPKVNLFNHAEEMLTIAELHESI